MLVILVILFTVKLYAQINIFNVIKKKHGQEMLKITRNLEELTTNHRKIKLDIDFIIKCKREGLIPTFASVRLAISHGTQHLRKNIARKIMEPELQHKHIEKRKIKKKILETTLKLRNNVSSINYWTLLHQINKAIKTRTKSILIHNDKKLKILRQRQHHNKESNYCNNYCFKHTVCNISLYQLSHDEYTALSFGLDHHIPAKTDPNLIYAEFVHKIENLSDDQKC